MESELDSLLAAYSAGRMSRRELERDTLKLLGARVIIPDMVYFEVTRHADKPGAQELPCVALRLAPPARSPVQALRMR